MSRSPTQQYNLASNNNLQIDNKMVDDGEPVRPITHPKPPEAFKDDWFCINFELFGICKRFDGVFTHGSEKVNPLFRTQRDQDYSSL